MKKTLLTIVALVTVLTANAQSVPVVCPTDVHLTSTQLTLTYSPSLPNSGFIDKVEVKIQGGGWKTLSLSSQTSTTITFNNQNAQLLSTQVLTKIKLIRQGCTITRCTQSFTLPVELTSFEGERNGKLVTFNFQTASELNNDYFELQGMINGEFTTLALQTGAGTTQETTDYQVTVENTNTEFFRLKQIDYDGTVDFSDVIAVFLRKEEKPLRVMRVNVLGVETPDGKVLLEIYKDRVVRTLVIQ
tara:strand:+ start:135 stop:869 length:735 start_codon:yes stop_codon:yes gene_type:complete